MNELIKRLGALSDRATSAPWQIHNEFSPMREQRCTIIANIDGETIEGAFKAADYILAHMSTDTGALRLKEQA